MSIGKFVYGNMDCADFGIVVAKKPNYPTPKRIVDTVTIPGRNGVLRMDTGAYENAPVVYECWFRGDAQRAHAVGGALLAQTGYVRLQDSYDTEHYRMASFDGPMDIENILGQGRYGQFEVSFDCKPQTFLLSGERPTRFSEAGLLYNPTGFAAKPVLRVYGSGRVTVNGCQCDVLSCDSYVDLDCETMQAYKDGNNCNGNVKIDTYPQLSAGANHIIPEGGCQVEITPRWWTV